MQTLRCTSSRSNPATQVRPRSSRALPCLGRGFFCFLGFFAFDTVQFIEGSLEVKLPTIWTDEKQSREEAERRERLEERRVEEKE